MITVEEHARRDRELVNYRLRCMRAALLRACAGDKELAAALYQQEKERLDDPADEWMAQINSDE